MGAGRKKSALVSVGDYKKKRRRNRNKKSVELAKARRFLDLEASMDADAEGGASGDEKDEGNDNYVYDEHTVENNDDDKGDKKFRHAAVDNQSVTELNKSYLKRIEAGYAKYKKQLQKELEEEMKMQNLSPETEAEYKRQIKERKKLNQKKAIQAKRRAIKSAMMKGLKYRLTLIKERTKDYNSNVRKLTDVDIKRIMQEAKIFLNRKKPYVDNLLKQSGEILKESANRDLKQVLKDGLRDGEDGSAATINALKHNNKTQNKGNKYVGDSANTTFENVKLGVNSMTTCVWCTKRLIQFIEENGARFVEKNGKYKVQPIIIDGKVILPEYVKANLEKYFAEKRRLKGLLNEKQKEELNHQVWEIGNPNDYNYDIINVNIEPDIYQPVKTKNLYSEVVPFQSKGGVAKYRLLSICANCYHQKSTILKNNLSGGAVHFMEA